MPFTEINGKTTFYSWKPASRAGLTLFFLHGLGGAHSFWSPVIPGLVEAGFSCLAIDVPGAFCLCVSLYMTMCAVPQQQTSPSKKRRDRGTNAMPCHILTLRPPGFGQSPYHGKPHDLHVIAEDSIALLESLGKSLDRTIIIGASMAGIVCCEIAVKHKVAGVVSVGPICPGPETKEAFLHRVDVVKRGQPTLNPTRTETHA